ncbi:MAG: pre-peptidase C-terminal domain-containing protein [Hyphomonadaceae bacterium]|nr:pre-peptidase C-terminal domain-containing protein [Hyphomonadaceae bacterium]
MMRGKLWFGVATAALVLGFTSSAAAQQADPPADGSTTATFTGAAIEGEISPGGDVDWYRMRVQQGMRYSFTLDGLAAPGQERPIDPVLSIYGASGNQVAYNDDANGLNSALAFTPSVSGEVFVEARAYGERETGRYRLSATAAPLPPDDAGNGPDTRARVQPGRAVSGNIEYEGDVDWYRLSARSGHRYRITLMGVESDAGELALGDPLLRVLDADGNELAMNDDDGRSLNSALDFFPRASGDVFVEARAYADAYTGLYALNVTAERMPTDRISSDRSTRGRIDLGQSIDGQLEFPTDTDWYRVRLTAGESYRFALNSSGDNPLSDPLLRVYDANGVEVAMDDDGGDGLNSYLEFTAPSSGAYFVEARGYSDNSVGGYTLSARAGDTPGDASTDLTLSADGDYREGVLSPAGDRDWFRIDLAEGQALRIGVDTAQTMDGLGDPYLVLYGPDGAEVARDDDGGEGLNAFLEYQATAAGAHFAEVRGYSENAEGRYVIGVLPGEIGASAETADWITPNGEGRTSIIGTPDDADWFMIELIEGRPYRFRVEGVGDNPLVDPYLRIYDGNGVEVAADDDGGTGLNPYLNFVSPTGGTYFAAVSAYGGGGTGRYTLSVSDTDVPGHIYTDEYLDSVNDSRISSIEMPGDRDTYRVSLEAGARYVIDVRGHGGHPLADAFLTLLDASGETILTDDDSGDGLDARLRYRPEHDGEYYIQASGLGGSTGGYQVQIVRQ